MSEGGREGGRWEMGDGKSGGVEDKKGNTGVEEEREISIVK